MWIDALFREIHQNSYNLDFALANTYTENKLQYFQNIQPIYSSWGDQGYGLVWLESRMDKNYRSLFEIGHKMIELSVRFKDNTSIIQEKALNQALKELMLAQSSDWPFILRAGTTINYAENRLKWHILNFIDIYNQLSSGKIDIVKIDSLEKQNSIFPKLSYKDFVKIVNQYNHEHF